LNRPVFTIIGGSNGAGKSTLTSSARNKFQQNPVLDPDAIAKSLQATLDLKNSNIEAGKVVLRRAEEACRGLILRRFGTTRRRKVIG
jgi:predicted ABC-type ATPase